MLHKHKRVKAVCGWESAPILSSLGDLGFVVDPQIFKDHHEFVESDLVLKTNPDCLYRKGCD